MVLSESILRISQRSRYSVIYINNAIVLFLMTGFPPSRSQEEFKITLKSPPNTTLLF